MRQWVYVLQGIEPGCGDRSEIKIITATPEGYVPYTDPYMIELAHRIPDRRDMYWIFLRRGLFDWQTYKYVSWVTLEHLGGC